MSMSCNVNIEDITSNENNANLLRRLKENDEEFTSMYVVMPDDFESKFEDYVLPEEGSGVKDMRWLGNFIGSNTTLKTLGIWPLSTYDFDDAIKQFGMGLSRNKSIEEIRFNRPSSKLFQSLGDFFKNSNSLVEIDLQNIIGWGLDDFKSLSLAIAGSNALKRFTIGNDDLIGEDDIVDGMLSDVFVALEMHPTLENIRVFGQPMGINDCVALGSTLCQQVTTSGITTLDLQNIGFGNNGVEALARGLAHSNQLKTLNLGRNVGDRGVDLLARALMHNSCLKTLILSCNHSITTAGWKSLSIILVSPKSNLQDLSVSRTGIDDDGIEALSGALVSNCKLETLRLWGHNITEKGWNTFSPLLCDTSTVNKTHLSNHTLKEVYGDGIPKHLKDLLQMNKGVDKKHVAMHKVLKNHPHFDMQPLFEWEFKTFAKVCLWFERAATCPDISTVDITKRKLSAIYQFVRGMPLLFIESHTLGELEKYRETKMKIRREQLRLSLQMNEAEDGENRAMMRLKRT